MYIVHYIYIFVLMFKSLFAHAYMYQVFLSNTNNLETDLFDPFMEP